MAASQKAEGKTPDRTPSDTTEAADAAEFTEELEFVSELSPWKPRLVWLGDQYVSVDRIESISTDADGRTQVTLVGRRAIATDVPLDDLLGHFDVERPEPVTDPDDEQ